MFVSLQAPSADVDVSAPAADVDASAPDVPSADLKKKKSKFGLKMPSILKMGKSSKLEASH